MSTITGYKYDTEGAYIEKDRLASLTYTMDWTDWLAAGELITAVAYTITAPTYNPTPLTISTSGILGGSKITYVKLAAGTVNKVYIVTAQITTDSSAVDRRQFKVKVENRTL
jgi:hypothetical protein